jgi:hypothetical protein
MNSKFIITGCGRSGTTYIAKLLTDLGCPCSHEEYFPTQLPKLIYLPGFNRLMYTPFYRVVKLRWPNQHLGEAAWQAAGFLDLLPADTVVLHQVRHPLDFIRSRQKKGVVYGRLRSMFTSVEYYPTKHDFVKLSLEKQVDYLARFWIEWNQLVEKKVGFHPYLRYRVEELDLNLLNQILDFIGFQCDPEKLQATYENISKKENTKGSTRSDISLELLSNEVFSQLETAAARYGYTNLSRSNASTVSLS